MERIRALQMPRKIENLQTVLQFLNDPEAEAADPVALLQAFARSTAAAKPWLVDNQYQALQNPGNVRLLHKLQPELVLSGLYEAPDVLFTQVERVQGPYPVVVNELLALARGEAAVTTSRWYALAEDLAACRAPRPAQALFPQQR